jgi:hypothetical protein
VSLTRLVLDEVRAGTPTVADIARHAGVDRGLVELAVERLVATGRLDAHALAGGCPPQGCGSCPSGSSCASGARGGGAVLLTLGSRRP